VVHEKLKTLLENPGVAKIVHDSKSTMNALSLEDSGKFETTFDPMLVSYINNPDDKHSLRDMADRLLGYSTVRTQEQPTGGRKQLTINFGAVDKVANVGADDARMALELARYYLDGRMETDQTDLLYDIDLPTSAVLARMEQAGLALDLPYMAEFSVELTRDISRLEQEIYALAGHAFNIGSTQQLQKVLFEELGLKSKARTKTGYSTDAAVLEGLKSEHQIIEKILEYRQLSKLRSTYVDALPKQVSHRDNRLHGEFNMTTTATGRLSSSNPNLQNIPIKTEAGRRIRQAFIPESPDSVLLSADYSQIELRLLAHMSGDPTLKDAFEKDQDIHTRTAGEIFDTPIEQVTPQQRRVGKTLNFALVYQQGTMATAQQLGISTKEAKAFIDKYFTSFSKVRGFMEKTIQEAREKGYVQTLWGRRRHFRNLNDKSDPVRKADERAAVNAPIQGSAADLMKLAMIRLDKTLAERKMKSRLILQVHDELVLEVPKSEIEEATQVLRESMLMDQPFTVPLKVDVGVGPNWKDAK
jgi:DNA polymerase-1